MTTATWSSAGDYVARIDGFAPGTSTAIFEDVLVTANNQGTGVLTVTRAQDGTGAQAFAAGAILTPVISLKMITDAFARIDSTGIALPPSLGGTVAPSSYGTVAVKINELAGDGLTNAITFSSIPANFRTLTVEVFGRATNAVTNNDLQVQFNADATGVYEWDRANLVGAAGTWASTQGNADTSMKLGFVTGTTAPTNTFAYTRFTIGFANSAALDKIVVAEGAFASSYAAGAIQVVKATGIWHNATPAAVTSIKLLTSAGFWATTALATVVGGP